MTGRTLVLGGGGITGIAWMLGLVAGLAERGVDLRAADDVVGTSAGSVVATQLATGVDIEERYAAQLVDPAGEVAVSLGVGTMLRLGLALIGPRDPQRVRARIGRLASRTVTMPETERLAVIGARLPVQEWPERSLRITAVDAHDGAFRVLDRTSGVPLVEAVASSCAVPGVYPPVTTGGTRYVDGGVRSPVNADLAEGAERVVVLAPIVRGIGPQVAVAPQVEALRAAGSRVVLVAPDAASVAAIGRNVLDPARRAGSARAGRAQAADVTDAIVAVWGHS
ncbi:patatin-like phospholipase family protein [Pseudonocardia abyssalis]|uniref:Patatin-like phospholipase family protein n=1 Tax=Pseudonocardia abyssalis TaxID=2792008 RepID=A0ABS6V063_9PSEU|nr:patatin-like phospholipase family protein [Pseudonocardia abyssalis]MBW0116116.1 patatin-like phospholipase family protein [Pseudonocardia abyssalis]MBW0137904.1 patatin-like phospholipase family protein [Pseudonocardia abyssalis]